MSIIISPLNLHIFFFIFYFHFFFVITNQVIEGNVVLHLKEFLKLKYIQLHDYKLLIFYLLLFLIFSDHKTLNVKTIKNPQKSYYQDSSVYPIFFFRNGLHRDCAAAN